MKDVAQKIYYHSDNEGEVKLDFQRIGINLDGDQYFKFKKNDTTMKNFSYDEIKNIIDDYTKATNVKNVKN